MQDGVYFLYALPALTCSHHAHVVIMLFMQLLVPSAPVWLLWQEPATKDISVAAGNLISSSTPTPQRPAITPKKRGLASTVLLLCLLALVCVTADCLKRQVPACSCRMPDMRGAHVLHACAAVH